jgi:iron complex transport system substrate-binding protein
MGSKEASGQRAGCFTRPEDRQPQLQKIRHRLGWRQLLGLALVVLAFSCSACGLTGGRQQGKAAAGAYTVTDEAGRTLHFTGKPQRIVSLTYGTDEILTGLVDVRRIVAYCKWAGDPEITFITREQAAKVGAKLGPDSVEAIMALHPDLVVLSVSSPAGALQALSDMGVNVYVAGSPNTYAAMQQKIRSLAAAVGETAQGEKMVTRMDQDLAAAQQPLAQIPPGQERVAMAFSYIGAIGRQGHLLDEIFKLAHVKNGAALAGLTPGMPALSKEKNYCGEPGSFSAAHLEFCLAGK